MEFWNRQITDQISFRLRSQWVLTCQRDAACDDANEDEVAPVGMGAGVVADDPESGGE